MSSRTKIVVLHMKEIIYTAIFAALAILLIILPVIMFKTDKKETDIKTKIKLHLASVLLSMFRTIQTQKPQFIDCGFFLSFND